MSLRNLMAEVAYGHRRFDETPRFGDLAQEYHPSDQIGVDNDLRC
jgi:hypothetical protein